MNTRCGNCLSLLLAWSLVLGWAAVATAGSGVVAEVGGEPILRTQVEERIRELHRNLPKIKAEGEAVSVDVAAIVQALVDERLMVQEAERLGLDNSESVRRGLAAYTRDQAVLRLRQIEVLDQARVSDEEVAAAFASQGGGQVSDQEREQAQERIRKAMLRRRIKERSEAYVQELAERLSLAVDRERLAALEPGREVFDGDAEVARVGEARVLAREVQAELALIAGNRQGMIRASHSDEAYAAWLDRSRDAALRNLTTPLLVEAEARRRGLEKDPAVAELAAVRRRALLVQALLVEVIAPLAEPDEAEMRAYLAAHPGEFARDGEFRFASMRFADPAAAEAMLAEIRQGAAFEYLAGTLEDRGQEDKTRVWVPGGELAPAVRRELESLQPGGVGGVVADGRGFVLLKLNGRRGGETLPFAEARDALRLAAGRRNFERVRAEYLARLRAAAGITIHQDALAGMEADLWRPLPDSAQSPAGEP